MAEPTCAQKAPYGVDLAAGDYFWCACGLSKKQPFCDGSHKGGEFTPKKFTITQAEKNGCAAASKKKTRRFATARIKRFNAFG